MQQGLFLRVGWSSISLETLGALRKRSKYKISKKYDFFQITFENFQNEKEN